MGNNKWMVVFLIIFLGALLQVAFVAADARQNKPYEVATNFAKAYFKLDPSMSQYLCNLLTEDQDTDVVDEYIYLMTQEAQKRGFQKSFMKNSLYAIHTKTEMVSEHEAQVRIAAKRRISICPFFAWVAQIFWIGETYSVDTTIDMVKEDGVWKVCGAPMVLGRA